MNLKFCDFWRSKWCRTNSTNTDIVQPKSMEDVKDVNPDFDDLIILQTNERIMQEIEISSSIETKANILLGVIGLIFTIAATVGLKFFIAIAKINIFLIFPLIIGGVFLIISFFCAFAIIRPRVKFRLVTPRKANNLLSHLPLRDVKYNVKYNLIENLEFMQNEGKKDLLYLRFGFTLFIIGLVSVSVSFVIQAGIELISKIAGK
jgi:hypothetical protein